MTVGAAGSGGAPEPNFSRLLSDFRADFEVFFNELCTQLLSTPQALGHC